MLNSLQFPFSAQFHILRHFGQVDKKYRMELKTNTSFTDEDINKQLAISGSKFYPEFAINPIQLWEKIQKHQDFFIIDNKIWKNGKAEIILFFKQEDYPKGIANDSLLRIDELLAEQKEQLQKEERNGFLVNYIKLAKPKPSWQVNVILREDVKPQLITIFPGMFAPPFPDLKHQNKIEWIESNRFWEQYVFNKTVF
jgi:hypothetical protein